MVRHPISSPGANVSPIYLFRTLDLNIDNTIHTALTSQLILIPNDMLAHHKRNAASCDNTSAGTGVDQCILRHALLRSSHARQLRSAKKYIIFSGNITKTMQTLNPGLYHHHRSWLQGVVKFVSLLMPFSAPDSVFRPHLITQMLLREVWWLTMGFWNQLSPRAAVTTMLFGKLSQRSLLCHWRG